MKQQFRCVECKHTIEIISLEEIKNLETYCNDCQDIRVFKSQDMLHSSGMKTNKE